MCNASPIKAMGVRRETKKERKLCRLSFMLVYFFRYYEGDALLPVAISEIASPQDARARLAMTIGFLLLQKVQAALKDEADDHVVDDPFDGGEIIGEDCSCGVAIFEIHISR